ncbi:hypothetical protein HifGL_001552 [Haemophilus influenzae KR494]|nr:hypothetical protein HifGL_001552 [Haemophilus influenzae KR494]
MHLVTVIAGNINAMIMIFYKLPIFNRFHIIFLMRELIT